MLTDDLIITTFQLACMFAAVFCVSDPSEVIVIKTSTGYITFGFKKHMPEFWLEDPESLIAAIDYEADYRQQALDFIERLHQ